MEELYPRELYLKKIRSYFDDKHTIKILTGVRGCGKSSILEMIIEELKEKSIQDENIIVIRLDKRPYKGTKTPEQLKSVIEKKSYGVSGLKYLFIDDIQNVGRYEEVLNACYDKGNFSIFVTGSNNYIMYPEHTKKLLAKYINYEIYTLSFHEYLEMKKFYGKETSHNLKEELTKYIMYGAFPYVVKNDEHDNMRKYSREILDKIFEKDVRHNKRVKNRKMFEAIKSYVINNFGTTISIKDMRSSLAETLGISVRKETLYNYLTILEDVKIVNKCSRFDMKEKKLLKGRDKYYLTDSSFYYAIDMYNAINMKPSLENVIYNYAKSMDYGVALGRVGKSEVDFIMEDTNMEYSYVQVTRSIEEGNTDENGVAELEEQTYKPLEKIRDFFPKYVMTLDHFLKRRNGIYHRNICNYMENEEKF